MLKWPSLEGLVLEAVRDEQAAACWSACNSGRTTCRTLQVSWCSMKLSTLLKQQTITTNDETENTDYP
jgi:hypothetical protein